MHGPDHRVPATAPAPRPVGARLARWASTLALATWGLAPLAAAPPDYRVGVDPGLATLAVRVCFPDALPRALEPLDRAAVRALRSPVLERGGQTLDLPAGARLPIPPGAGPGCVRYRVDLTGALGDAWHGLGRRVRGAVLLSPRIFLWTPPLGADGGLPGATLGFDLPAGMAVSAPWAAAPSGERGALGSPGRSPANPRDGQTFGLGQRPLDWDARVAVGRFERFDLDLPGGQLAVALLAGDPPAPRPRVEPWLSANAAALGCALDPAAPRLPVTRLQVLAVPTGAGDEPVPWGEVMRGGGDAVHLYIDQTRPQAEFLADWVLIHELSHLLHPYMEGDGRWLYEGIASYYQNVLPVRAGWRGEQEGLRRLHAGFRRGQKGTKPGQTLARASSDMMRDRGFMRVYWSGAAIAMLGDLELRQASGGRQSLDWALAELRRREGPYDRRWSAREVVAGLDRVTGRSVFAGLAGRWLESDRFPDLGPAYRALGILPTSDTQIRLGRDPGAVALRAQVMGLCATTGRAR